MTKQIQAALAMIHSGMAISLGGGNHMKSLAKVIADSELRDIRICSPSEATITYCQQLGLTLDRNLTHTDLAFDGCDCIDENLSALKSNGAIFTYEKRHALLSDQFVILSPASRYQPQLDAATPLTIELIEAALPLVTACAKRLGLRYQLREAANYMGYTRTRDGNLLVDCFADTWQNIAVVNQQFSQLPGVLDTSWFDGIVTSLLLETADEDTQLIRKEN